MDASERALDAALALALCAPPVPAGLRAQLNAALVRESAAERSDAARARLERQRRERLAELETGYLRLRRRAAGTMIAGAVAAGAAVRLLMPWFNATFGPNAVFAIAACSALAGLAIGTVSWMRHTGFPNPLELF
jgi:hypothetical protein